MEEMRVNLILHERNELSEFGDYGIFNLRMHLPVF